jgi:hypothetical protein
LAIGTGIGEDPMKVIFTVELTKRHVQDADLLEAYIRDAVTNFNIHTRTGASVGSVHILSDAFEVKKGQDQPRGDEH